MASLSAPVAVSAGEICLGLFDFACMFAFRSP